MRRATHKCATSAACLPTPAASTVCASLTQVRLWCLCNVRRNAWGGRADHMRAHAPLSDCPAAGHCLASAADRGELIIWRPDPRAAATTQPAATSPAHGGAPPVAAAYGTPLPPSQPRDKASSSSTPGSALPLSPLGEASPAAAVGGDGGWAQAGAWRQSATLRGHLNDVTDVAWAHDDAVVMSGSVDSEVMLFDVEGRKTLVSGGWVGAKQPTSKTPLEGIDLPPVLCLQASRHAHTAAGTD